jgi:membrane-anchored glycerophosphoryl diester phosphodiesterase (GDPDase)
VSAGERWKLVGLALVLALGTLLYLATCVSLVVLAASLLPNPADVLVAVLVGFLAFFGMIYLWARVYYLAVPPLMLEPVGVFGALRRSWTLTARQFWRTFGIALLMLLITQTAGSLLSLPVTLVGSVLADSAGPGQAGLFLTVVSTALAVVVSSAFVAPFKSAVTTLQYVDQRMRKEGYDVELLTRVGLEAR